MTEATFRARLAALGITLDAKAFAAAFKGAQHLRAEVARIDAYLAAPGPTT
jgi:hypothetical protein